MPILTFQPLCIYSYTRSFHLFIIKLVDSISPDELSPFTMGGWEIRKNDAQSGILKKRNSHP